MLTLKLAFRNLFRNTRRTLLTMLLVSFSLCALIMTDAIIQGMTVLMVKNVTETLNGHGQIHHPKFRESFEGEFILEDTQQSLKKIQNDPEIKAAAARTLSGAMVSSSYNISSGLIYGVNAEAELQLSKLKQALVEGAYLSGGESEIMIGNKMAELLEVKLGNRIVLTLSEAKTGELAQALFRISGIFEFGIREMDSSMVFINLKKAQQVLGLTHDESHQIAFNFYDPKLAEDKRRPVFTNFTNRESEALNWPELNNEISSIIEITGFSSLIIGAVLFLLTSLGVINSMFMSIYERIYEFGVLKAVGARPSALASLILTEAAVLGFLSCLLGVFMAYLLGSYTAVNGIPLGEMEFSGVAIDNNIKTIFTSQQFTNFPIYVVLLTIVASIYPAIFAARITPSAALQKSL